jgi:predicted ATP-binding protein involved in virulence
MPKIIIHDFSCIDYAELELKPITILIGPQASGKSLISKLIYFFADITNIQYRNAEDGDPLKLFQKQIRTNFYKSFPPLAWGGKAFKIQYVAGLLEITVERKISGGKISDEVNVKTSEFFNKQYEDLLFNYKGISKKISDDDDFYRSSFERSWPIRRESVKNLKSKLKSEYVASQTFIPAGRSFFSNLGKAVAILEHGSPLDEVTKQFGRMFTSLLDRRYPLLYAEKPSQLIKDFLSNQKKSMDRIIGGEIKLARNDMHVAVRDGRKIPLSLLSSGQQELLPLLLILQYYTASVAGETEPGIEVLYVEEPEAHLFPEAQGLLTEHLVEIANFSHGVGRLVITTHSPYVLAKLNNLLKASTVANISKGHEQKVQKVVNSSAWLDSGALNAYALQRGRLQDITSDGLIDAGYLDGISADISETFMTLLEIELSDD